MTYPVIDLELARRLERAEGAANARFVEARARVEPARAACWTEVAGTWAMFDGVGSPLTQTFGLGMSDAPDAATLDALETFFLSRGASVEHEISPLALGTPLPLLSARGYVPIELTSVMFRPVTLARLAGSRSANDPGPAGVAAPALPATPAVRMLAPDREPAWSDASADGWSEMPELVPVVREIGAVYAQTQGARCFAAEIDGVIAATGVLALHDGVAVLAGASTRPAYRRRGAQLALLDARLRQAQAESCDLAMMCAAPGSASQRNAERHGFHVAYTRIKWRLAR